jgi:hypothetical protein
MAPICSGPVIPRRDSSRAAKITPRGPTRGARAVLFLALRTVAGVWWSWLRARTDSWHSEASTANCAKASLDVRRAFAGGLRRSD